MSVIDDEIAAGRQSLLNNDAVVTNQLHKTYLDTVEQVSRDAEKLDDEIYQMELRGEEVTPAKLFKKEQYAQIIAESDAAARRFEDRATPVLDKNRTRVIANGLTTADRALGAGGFDRSTLGGVNTKAVENVQHALNSTPLHESLSGYSDFNRKQIEKGILTGVARGRQSRKIADEIRRNFEGPAPRARIETLVRTESARAMRAAQMERWEKRADDLEGLRWLAGHSARTCAACLAMDGKIFPVKSAKALDLFHVSCRCMWSPVPKGYAADYEDGETWLRQQPVAVQDHILGKMGGNLFRSNGFGLMDFLGIKTDRKWGDSVYQLSAKTAQRRGHNAAEIDTLIVDRLAPEPSKPTLTQGRVIQSDESMEGLITKAGIEVDAGLRDKMGRLADDSRQLAKDVLTTEERAALDRFGNLEGYQVNQYLRNGRQPPDPSLDHMIDGMDGLTSILKMDEGTRMFRGIDQTSPTHPLVGLEPGSVVRDRGFMSTSPDPFEAARYTLRGEPKVFMDLTTGPGVTGWYKGSTGEYILPRNTVTIIDSVTRASDGGYFYKGRVLIDDGGVMSAPIPPSERARPPVDPNPAKKVTNRVEGIEYADRLLASNQLSPDSHRQVVGFLRSGAALKDSSVKPYVDKMSMKDQLAGKIPVVDPNRTGTRPDDKWGYELTPRARIDKLVEDGLLTKAQSSSAKANVGRAADPNALIDRYLVKNGHAPKRGDTGPGPTPPKPKPDPVIEDKWGYDLEPKARVDKLVADGYITKAQGGSIKANLSRATDPNALIDRYLIKGGHTPVRTGDGPTKPKIDDGNLRIEPELTDDDFLPRDARGLSPDEYIAKLESEGRLTPDGAKVMREAIVQRPDLTRTQLIQSISILDQWKNRTFIRKELNQAVSDGYITKAKANALDRMLSDGVDPLRVGAQMDSLRKAGMKKREKEGIKVPPQEPGTPTWPGEADYIRSLQENKRRPKEIIKNYTKAEAMPVKPGDSPRIVEIKRRMAIARENRYTYDEMHSIGNLVTAEMTSAFNRIVRDEFGVGRKIHPDQMVDMKQRAYLETMGQLRPMYDPNARGAKKLPAESSKKDAHLLDMANEAMSLYPKQWIDKTVNRLNQGGDGVMVMQVERGHWRQPRDGELAHLYVSGDGMSRQSTMVHEVAHMNQYGNELIQTAKEFHKRRTGDDPLVEIKTLPGYAYYPDGERAKPDKFWHPYVGKEYNSFGGSGSPLELLSMSMEEMTHLGRFNGKPLWETDPDAADWLLGVLVLN